MEATHDKLDRIYKTLAVIGLAIAGLIFAKDIVMPIAFGALFSMVLLPLAKRFESRTGRIFSIVLVLLFAFFVMLLIFWFVAAQLASLSDSLPDLEGRFMALINSVSEQANTILRIDTHEQTQLLKDGLKNFSSYFGSLLLSTSYFAYFFIQVPIYIFLFLLYRERFNDFLLAVWPTSSLSWKSEIQAVIRGYISGLTLVTLIAAVLNSIGLLLLGIEHAIFFGFLSGTLTMIPYVGITIGAALPTLLALVTKDSGWYAVGVIAVHSFVQFLEGNFITPKITGSKISINALAAIVALLVGGKIWGIAGMILAVPAVGILKILLSYSTSLKPFVILLEDKHPELPAEEVVEEIPEKTD
ncbi:MAG: AI-2E family transporter [Cytophagales bacterium]|nr:AI-2E family transporter [Cytophagales bacterium]MCA6368590.1 AI-2E family transporter [Cytophagales bacterium]MCA6370248.1 AI-2E family transporter [Cytophagales bacterium]MCA6374613.1 AI-2E family transporter [Cytophagales bacterium]MCA6385084.1 AI-2E family transporter [Cytophagales bacterium]